METYKNTAQFDKTAVDELTKIIFAVLSVEKELKLNELIAKIAKMKEKKHGDEYMLFARDLIAKLVKSGQIKKQKSLLKLNNAEKNKEKENKEKECKKFAIKVQDDELVFNENSSGGAEFEVPQRALKFLCYFMTSLSVERHGNWQNEKEFYESGELKTLSFEYPQYSNEHCKYTFSKSRELEEFSCFDGDEAKITNIEYFTKDGTKWAKGIISNYDIKDLADAFGDLDNEYSVFGSLYKKDVDIDELSDGEYRVEINADNIELLNMVNVYDEYGLLQNIYESEYETELARLDDGKYNFCYLIAHNGGGDLGYVGQIAIKDDKENFVEINMPVLFCWSCNDNTGLDFFDEDDDICWRGDEYLELREVFYELQDLEETHSWHTNTAEVEDIQKDEIGFSIGKYRIDTTNLSSYGAECLEEGNIDELRKFRAIKSVRIGLKKEFVNDVVYAGFIYCRYEDLIEPVVMF